MSDEDDAVDPNPRVVMRTSAANGFDGNEVKVEVEGGDDDTIDDVEDVAKRRFDQAVDATGVDDTDRVGYQ